LLAAGYLVFLAGYDESFDGYDDDAFDGYDVVCGYAV
jgi:hypothetical protein